MWPKLALNSRCSCLNLPSSLDCICPWCCINLSLLKVTMCTCLGTKTLSVPLWRRLPFLGHYWFLEGMWEGKTCFFTFFFFFTCIWFACVYRSGQRYLELESTGSCELPALGTGNTAPVQYKSLMLSHGSSPIRRVYHVPQAGL